MARITAGVATSHVPAFGVAVDFGKIDESYWKPASAGYEWTRIWERDVARPGVVMACRQFISEDARKRRAG